MGVEGGYGRLKGVGLVYVAGFETLVRVYGPDESVTQGHAQDARRGDKDEEVFGEHGGWIESACWI